MFSWSRLKKEILKSEVRFLLAISGGVDSMVLLDFFIRSIPKDRFVVAHFNHNSRKGDIDDANLVYNKCWENSIPFVMDEGSDLKGIGNFENEARKQRWAFLNQTALREKCDLIVTAHHKNDLIETYILQALLRGVPAPYSVMNTLIEVDGFYRYKPFLQLTKRQIINAAYRFNVDFNEDETNLDQNFERNFIRHSIIPLMQTKRNVLKTIPKSLKSFSNGLELKDVKIRDKNMVSSI